MIPLAEPSLGGNEARYLRECVDTGFVSSAGSFVGRFEREFAAAVGTPYAVACASGTAALHVALRIAGAGPGTVVAVSDFTFISSANAAHYTGAELLLVDSEPDTWNMDTELLHDEVVRRARLGRPIPEVVEIVHVLGHPAHMEPLFDLRDRFWIDIVEDAAESLGASWTTGPLAGRQVGTVGDLGCYSFNGNKIMTAGGGGMIVTPDGDRSATAAHLTTQAKVDGEHYQHDEIGYNYRLTNIAAAVATAQLEQLPAKVAAKRELARRYSEALRAAPVAAPPSATWADPTFWLYSVLLDDPGLDPEKIVAALAADGIQARRLWPPLHDQRPYRTADRLGGAVAKDLYRRGLSLPSSVTLSERDQHTVVAALTSALEAS
jgi:dTDP-4-amino-4,6-dideoxygalactose transaminase